MTTRSSSSRKKSATKGEAKRAAFRDWLQGLADGRSLDLDQRWNGQAGTSRSEKIAQPWLELSKDAETRARENPQRSHPSWRQLAPPL